MLFSQDDHMVQAVSAYGTNQPFHVGPLPWTGWSGRDFCDTHSSDSFPKVTPLHFVSIPQQVAGCGIVWKRLNNLSPCPRSGGMFGHVEVNHPSAVMTQHHEDEHNPKGSRGTVKKSIETRSCTWLFRKAFQVWEGGFLFLGISREAVRSETSMPSLRSSP